MSMRLLSFLSALALGGVLGGAENEEDRAGLDFFESKIRPVLVEHCYECHSTASGTANGGLLVDSRQALRAGGEHGPAVVPGAPQASVLLAAISHTDADLEMPPTGKRLPDRVIADFKRWIESGASDPRDAVASETPQLDVSKDRDFWSLKPVRASELPLVADANWPRRDLDHFVWAQLAQVGLSPSPDAEAETLLRRLSFDLTGLPPTPQRLVSFRQLVTRQGIDSALEMEVDRLLASRQYGERWGRHWLDVARFAESSGKETNVTFPHAWRYRNYVIKAFNEDRPYDQFLTEQIAGDLLPFTGPEDRAELWIATGFLAVGPKGLNESNKKQFRADLVDEQIDTLTRSVMASSVACARCHDHKFDPYSMEDYYALAGVFQSTQTYFGTAVAPGNQVGGKLLRLPEYSGQLIPNSKWRTPPIAKLKEQLESLHRERIDRTEAAQRAREKGGDPSKYFSLTDALRIIWQTGRVENQLQRLGDDGDALPMAMGVSDGESIGDAQLLDRGDIQRPGDTIPRRFPAVIDVPHEVSASQSGRLELARWLVDPAHPLTARVMANRVWHHLLGAGLVRTVDNFGHNGERPSHPELLDHLALRLVDNNWSIKQLVREVVLSRTYRQASTFRAAAYSVDPENRWLWRASKRRLDAEAIRDAMLAVSGELKLEPPQGSLMGRIGDKPVSLLAFDKRVPADLDGSSHRSVYLPVVRDRLPDVLDLFDFAEPSLVTGARETTNVPLQALYLMNSSFVWKQAEAFAARLQSARRDAADQVRLASLLCFGRSPSDKELNAGVDFLRSSDSTVGDSSETLVLYCQALLATAEFRNLD